MGEEAEAEGEQQQEEEESDMNAQAFCRPDDAQCIKMMEDYEKWRLENGYGMVGGRWG